MSTLEEQLRRLADTEIQLIPAAEIATHFLFERGGFVALVERTEAGFGGIGAPGLLDGPSGYAALVERAGERWFVGRGFERRATADEVASIRRFAADLSAALK